MQETLKLCKPMQEKIKYVVGRLRAFGYNHVVTKEYMNGKELKIDFISPKRSQALVNHSPDGFMWGYHGSGPAQLALAILLEFTTEEVALKLYQLFKTQVIACLKQEAGFRLKAEDIQGWIDRSRTEYDL